MKCSFRQLLSMVIALVLVLSCVPFQVFAEECEHAFAEGVCTVCGAAEVPAEEPAAEPVEEPAEEAIEEPVEEPAAEPAEEITEEPVEPAEEAVAVEAEAEVEMAGDGLDGGEIDANESFTLKVKINPSSVTTEDQLEDIDIIVSVWNAENERVNDLNTSYIITNAAGQEVTLAVALQTPGTYTVTPSYYDDGWSAVTVETATLTVEEPKHPFVNDTTGAYYESLKKALAAARAGDVIHQTRNWTEAADITIGTGVILHLDVYTLTVEGHVIGLQGSKLRGTNYKNDGNPYAKLIATKGLYMLSEDCFVSSGYSYVPMYLDGGYVFGRFAVNTDAGSNANRGLKVDVANKELYFQFFSQTTGAVRTDLMTDGFADNELTVYVRLVW